jgi:hypothetical protein
MSLSTLTKIAVQREHGVPKATKKKPEPRAEGEPKKEYPTEKRSYLSTLAAAIPTEPLALYTFLVATIVATIGPGDDERLFMRWAIYAATIAVIVLWLGASHFRNLDAKERKRRFPWLEAASATVAFAAWGLAMPESPLNAELSGDDRTIWTAIVTVAGVLVLGMLGKDLKEEAKPKKKRRRRKQETPPAKQPA